MKIRSLHVYPIKALRGIPLEHAQLGPQGIRYDRRFMLYTVRPNGEWKKMQLDSYPQCALFEQQIIHRADSSGKDSSVIVVRYHQPADGEASSESETTTSSSPPPPPPPPPPIEVPLNPEISSLEAAAVDLHGSPASAYRMGDHYDAWFSECFGIPVILVYIGDGKRAVLGNTLPPKAKQQPKQPATPERQKGWMSSLASYVTGSKPEEAPAPWLTFTDVAPFLVTSESSLKDVCARFPDDQPVGMFRFRPNIVVDGDGEEAWAEDFWTELTIGGHAAQQQTGSKLALTGNCGRCTSLNVDYQTGKPSTGEMGNVLKKLMKDRRVDPGVKYSPVFGRYAFLEKGGDAGEFVTVSVGDEVQVTGRSSERSVWDWPGL
ncbi:hypothetical protein B0T19DRAFT_491315 [Cercophora scortea]|uniref:MOSC domain-containing protein n=1 Tax=Cercophora scortea TaxID=314031 RepID=A0AAE0MJK8_9PEZI|nr:hypothetical protein B0T19DRAFT_491315 [Cercophora scortea]